MEKTKIYVISKNQITQRMICCLLEDAGYLTTQSAKEAFLMIADMPAGLSELEKVEKRIYLCERGDSVPKESGGILTKPFLHSELIKMVGQMCREENKQSELKLENDTVFYNGMKVKLSGREAKLLEYFLAHEGEEISREILLESVWDNKESGTNITDVYVNYLRAKLKKIKLSPIKAVRGKGYVFVVENNE